jgi:hypothetical protein
MTDSIPVFVNGRRVMLPKGGTAAMAVAQDVSASASRPDQTGVTITDARGLPVSPETVLVSGAILRVAVSARRASGADADT